MQESGPGAADVRGRSSGWRQAKWLALIGLAAVLSSVGAAAQDDPHLQQLKEERQATLEVREEAGQWLQRLRSGELFLVRQGEGFLPVDKEEFENLLSHSVKSGTMSAEAARQWADNVIRQSQLEAKAFEVTFARLDVALARLDAQIDRAESEASHGVLEGGYKTADGITIAIIRTGRDSYMLESSDGWRAEGRFDGTTLRMSAAWDPQGKERQDALLSAEVIQRETRYAITIRTNDGTLWHRYR